ncbi:hypothetical protein DLAC_01834 [Tieghemostelium lacteum]|uniref:Inositol-pentakisphosphate 2-kinase n=1 Tax=Tieghemostelium lacteum TaxID=361077 RepID=A0A152A6S8_TIELA|nr:hypothetical protein DLAC_01834 [Tieghemostelium lacteum]|eukprot:KYR01821.1 hypothetical protein DLAC_01834 [Tieghemostelium lacteum]
MQHDHSSITNIDIGTFKYWKYKGEGACNVVLTYHGPNNSKLNGRVLRVKKTNVSSTTIGTLLNGNEDQVNKDISDFKFVADKMSFILNSRYVYPGEIIRVTKEFLEQLDEHILNDRPKSRSKLRIDTNITIAFLIQDLSMFRDVSIPGHHFQSPKENFSPSLSPSPSSSFTRDQIICIEIKPKWGFLQSRSEFITNAKDVKSNTCRYCMHQYIKLQEGSISEISNYCPLDLYCNSNDNDDNNSMNIDRKKKAIKELFYHPQNNLKIYIDGELAFTGSLGGGNDLSKEESIQMIGSLFRPTLSTQSLCELVSAILSRESILSNLKSVQLYDELDIEAIYYLYCKLNQIPNTIGYQLNSQSKLDQLTNDQIREYISRFLISATVKDCSIMLSFNNNSKFNSDTIQSFKFINSLDISSNTTINFNDNNIIYYKIGIVDLDKKKESSIPNYYKTDKLIIENYQNNCNNKKQCTE